MPSNFRICFRAHAIQHSRAMETPIGGRYERAIHLAAFLTNPPHQLLNGALAPGRLVEVGLTGKKAFFAGYISGTGTGRFRAQKLTFNIGGPALEATTRPHRFPHERPGAHCQRLTQVGHRWDSSKFRTLLQLHSGHPLLEGLFGQTSSPIFSQTSQTIAL